MNQQGYKGPLDYIDVATRIVEFRTKHPEGSLQQVRYELMKVGERTFLAFTAAAYRTPDDARPGIGTAWEPVPGPTQFTRDSELQNAETAAWGRAIVAALAADTKRGVASAEEVRNRQADRQAPPVRQLQAQVWNRSREKDPDLTDDDRRMWIAGELAKLGGDRDNPDTLQKLLKEWA
jgi:hypothetical protein